MVTGEALGFLGALAPDDAADLASLGRTRRYRQRSTLFFEGDDAHDVLVIGSGEVKVAVNSAEGREIVLDVLGPGEILGELSAIDGFPRSATATALTAVEVFAVDMVRFNAFIDTHHAAALALLRSITKRLRGTTRRQVEFGTVDALGRVCGRITEMIDRYGQPNGDSITIPTMLSQTEVAGWAGLSREAVVKALAALRALGWITTSGRAITVIAPPDVRARARVTVV
jgi:CRP-like cAMP-binding protein